jgi:hypothetical protein
VSAQARIPPVEVPAIRSNSSAIRRPVRALDLGEDDGGDQAADPAAVDREDAHGPETYAAARSASQAPPGRRPYVGRLQHVADAVQAPTSERSASRGRRRPVPVGRERVLGMGIGQLRPRATRAPIVS